jgi:hypothetical protein
VRRGHLSGDSERNKEIEPPRRENAKVGKRRKRGEEISPRIKGGWTRMNWISDFKFEIPKF